MAKNRNGRTTPTDREAGTMAQTARHPHNLEEASAPRAAAAAGSAARCKKCDPLPAVPDPKGLHKCGRCRSELLPEVARRRRIDQERQIAERNAARAEEKAAERKRRSA